MKSISTLLYIFLLSVAFGSVDLLPQTTKNGSGDKDSLEKESDNSLLFYDTSAIFKEDWKVNITFSYAKNEFNEKSIVYFTDSIHSYAFPVEKKTTSGFGRRHGSFHKGIDIPIKTGEAIVAAFDGKVRYATYNSGGFGNLVIIRHANGLETYYAHLSRLKVKANQIVKAGDVIGLGGSTGRSYSPHLHFEMRYHDVAFDPEKVFDTENYCLRNENSVVADLMLKSNYKYKAPINHDHLAEGSVYSIKSGDTLSKIAARNGKTVEQLCDLNGLSRSSVLQIGQRIRVN
jgi:murein DD-endopeptidase MepM/ murein hydrolase activator NlpD